MPKSRPRSRHRRHPPRVKTARPAPSASGKTPLPAFDSMAEAQAFLATADLDAYDLGPVDAARPADQPLASGPRPQAAPPPAPHHRNAPQHEYAPKSARLTMRLPETLLQALKTQAQAAGLPYQRLIRQALERAVAGGS